MREIYINLPVKDLERTMGFFGELGFEFNPEFTDEAAACMVIGEGSYAMLLSEERFADFITGEIADPSKSTEVINCFSAVSREEVDELVAKALASGGAAHKPIMEQGPMYAGSFLDPDGHVWEVLFMDQS